MTETHRNVVSVSWGDHLDFGEGDGRLDTPEKLAPGEYSRTASLPGRRNSMRQQSTGGILIRPEKHAEYSYC